MRQIVSRDNVKFKLWKSLLEARGIKKEKMALVSGAKIVDELLKTKRDQVEAVLLPPHYDGPDPGRDSFQLERELFETLDVVNTRSPLLVFRTPEIPIWRPEPPEKLELVAALADPGNLGAVLRSAEAFGVTRVILTEESCSPFLPKAVRASSGACFHVALARAGKLADFPIDHALKLDMQGEDIRRFVWPENVRLVLGQEGLGMPMEWADARSVKIAMTAGESLNATVAASIALFSYRSNFTD